MNEKQLKAASKFLSFILRHKPQTIGLHLDEEGWADINELLEQSAQQHEPLSRELLVQIVETNNKKRFAFNANGTKIRASQEHSIAIDLKLGPQEPPEHLFHGTVAKFLEAIRKDGLQKMDRQQVHLSTERETAMAVGNRRGAAVLLTINARQMHDDGISFFISENGVWLTDQVPSRYIDFKNATQ